MDTNNTAIAALRLSRRAAKRIGIISVVGCLAVTGLAAAVHGAGAAAGAQSSIVSVDHTRKGDRLPVASKPAPTVSSPMVTTLSRPPIGCDPAFSPLAASASLNFAGRCLS